MTIDLSNVEYEDEEFVPVDPSGETFEDFLDSVRNSPEKSLMAQIAALPEDQQREALEGIDPEALLYDWAAWARPSQLLPEEGWNTAVYVAGRGAGKTRTGAEFIRKKAMSEPGCRIGLLARTAADTRDTLVKGESGILAVHPPSERPTYVEGRRSITWENGSQATLFSDVAPDSLRGPQFHYAWADEIATFNHNEDASGLTAWNNLRIATRLGDHPQIITTTTPKRVPIIEDLIAEAETGSGTIVLRGKTIDNEQLPISYLSVLWHQYKGTHLWRQEVLGELIGAIDGALWDLDCIEKNRVTTKIANLPLRVVAIDPTVASEPKDECGIIVVGSTANADLHRRHAYVLEDATVMGSPEVWAQRAVEVARRYKCPIVAEGNQGQELVRMVIQSIDPTIPVYLVNARQNKQTRAEPVSTAYQAGRVHHVGLLPELEQWMTTWLPGETKKSPDRIDALVWGIYALLIKPPKELSPRKPLRATSMANRSLGNVVKRYKGHLL